MIARIARAVVVGALLLVSFAALPAHATQTDPWVTFPSEDQWVPAGAPPILLVGDSLINSIGTNGHRGEPVAQHLRTITGRGSYVSSAGGASWVTYVWPGQQSANALIGDYARYLGARLTVGALGSNDERIMNSNPGSLNQQSQYAIMYEGVRSARETSACVLLVNTYTGSGSALFPASTMTKVNDNMAWLAAAFPGGHVWVADWNAKATGHGDWFLPNDVHMTTAGQLQYAAFIGDWVKLLIAAGC